MKWSYLYFLTAVYAMVLTTVITPMCRKLSWKFNFLDRPLGEHHKRHQEPMPLLGGVAMLMGWSLTIISATWFIHRYQESFPDQILQILSGLILIRSPLFVITSGALVLTLIGLVDDKKPLGPMVKFSLQLVVCSIVALSPKLRISLFFESVFVTWFITLCWFMFIINAFNFFDNMDGLASGIAVIASVLFTLVAAFRGQYFVAALGSATAGTAIGFYFFNRYPASIFMGDSGSHFLGFVLAVMGALTLFYQPETTPTIAPLLIPILVLAVPIFDTFAVIFIRLKNRKPIYSGDHNHISHRFHHMGVSRKTAVFLVHLLSLAIGLGAVTMMWLEKRGVVLVLLQSFAILTLVTILHRTRISDNQ